MTGLIDSAFGRITSIPRSLKIIPKEASTPQKSLDILRGKIKPKGSSLFGKPLTRIGRQSRSLLGTEVEEKKGRGTLLTSK